MKKVTVLLILSLAICLAACGKKVSTPDEMLDVVKEKENISAEVDMIECGRIVDNDTTIVMGKRQNISLLCSTVFQKSGWKI